MLRILSLDILKDNILIKQWLTLLMVLSEDLNAVMNSDIRGSSRRIPLSSRSSMNPCLLTVPSFCFTWSYIFSHAFCRIGLFTFIAIWRRKRRDMVWFIFIFSYIDEFRTKLRFNENWNVKKSSGSFMKSYIKVPLRLVNIYFFLGIRFFLVR